MWSIVGSVGTVNLGDIGKVNFAGSEVQIGYGSSDTLGRSGAVDSLVAEEAPATAPVAFRNKFHPKIQAILRYGVTTPFVGPEDISEGKALSLWELALTYRDGAGQVVATLIEVSISDGGLGGQQETRLIRFDSQHFPEPSPKYRTNAARANPLFQNHALDFDSNTYYVELSLTAPETLQIGHGPAVAVVALRPIDGVD